MNVLCKSLANNSPRHCFLDGRKTWASDAPHREILLVILLNNFGVCYQLGSGEKFSTLKLFLGNFFYTNEVMKVETTFQNSQVFLPQPTKGKKSSFRFKKILVFQGESTFRGFKAV